MTTSQQFYHGITAALSPECNASGGDGCGGSGASLPPHLIFLSVARINGCDVAVTHPCALIETAKFGSVKRHTPLKFIPVSQRLRDRTCDGGQEGHTPPVRHSFAVEPLHHGAGNAQA